MAALRAPDGCPWDREQTVESLRPFVLEEACEVLDAIDAGDRDALCHEIGDLIFEGVFLAQLCAEEGAFTVADSIESIVAKLVRRHPHVFARESAAPGTLPKSARQVVERWDDIKAAERVERGQSSHDLLGNLPRSLPALLRAHAIGRRAASVGFDWTRPADVVTKIEEEVAEVRQAVEVSPSHLEEEIGDLLFSIANLARQLDVEPEAALQKANAKFTRRFAAMQAGLAARGLALKDATPDQLEDEWARVKSS